MNKQAVLQTWDHIRQVNGVGLRAIEMFPEAQLDAAVIPGMRTPKQVVVHMYGQIIRAIAEGAVSGTISNENEHHEAQISAGLKSKADLLRYCHECWAAADAAVQAMPEERVLGITATPWNMSFPGFVAFTIISDEYIHHRGQLYAYLRTLGIAPPCMWSFAENAEPFRPKATA